MLSLEWNGDFSLSSAGTILLASAWDEIRQRIIRRVLTNSAQTLPDGTTTPPGYLFDPRYGLGGGAMVSQAMSPAQVNAFVNRIRAGVMADAAVMPGVAPTIALSQPQPHALLVHVGVTLAGGQIATFSLTAGGVAAAH